MPTSPDDLTDEEIAQARSGVQRRLNCGQGLSVFITDKEQKYFQLRAHINGESKVFALGTFPNINLEEARKRAAALHAEIQLQRKKIADAKNKEKIRSAGTKPRKETKREPCFATFEDARLFYSLLEDARTRSGAQERDKEAQVALQLQLLLPAKSANLLHAQWQDFNLELGLWQPRKSVANEREAGASLPFDYLAEYTTSLLRCWQSATGRSEFLFPQLSQKKTTDAAKDIVAAAKEIWNKYAIDPDQFPSYFKSIALTRSYFRETLINEVVARRTPSPEKPILAPDEQRRALYRWWTYALRLPI